MGTSGPIITTPPPPPPPHELEYDASVSRTGAVHNLICWYWSEGYRAGYRAAKAESPMFKVKRWWKSRTLWFNGVVTVALGTAVAYLGDVRMALGEYGAAGVVALVVGNALWRFATDGKLTK